ncbi:nuclear transport factor 2 family protein [Nocardioides sp. W7]|uniref:nuclear transport factor 2 family protein n=1 Tax=Nocardioides sp. W7 TaxID=2931390 RepID=UPI001FCFD226|nr:nuclear transport factor 2 family protein [Nocardioides sp. W7]
MSIDTDVTTRLAALEGRLRQLEDEREIQHLIAGYGPLVDAGAADEVAALWTEDGVYDVDEVFLGNQEAIRAMVLSKGHQGWIRGGCAHFVGPARVTVDGDDAVAVGHSLMVVNTEDGFVVRRATANHWQLRRTPEGWRATVRTNRVLDGRPESPALLAAGALGKRP